MRDGHANRETDAIAIDLRVSDLALFDEAAALIERMEGVRLASDPDHAGVVVTDAPPEPGETAVVIAADPALAMRVARSRAASVAAYPLDPSALLLAIRAARAGLVSFPRTLHAEGVDHDDEPFAGTGAGHEVLEGVGPSGDPLGEVSLTQREREVLGLMSHGASNKEIARELRISVHTAKFHVASVVAKLGARRRTDAVGRALRLGLTHV